MAINLKRKREAISYKEPSSDEDFSDEAESSRAPRRQRPTPQRRSVRQRRSSAEQSPDKPSSRESSPRATKKKAKPASVQLRGRRKISYRESSSEDDFDDDFEPETPPPPSTSHTRTKRSPHPKSATKGRGRPRRTLGAPLRQRKPSPEQAEAPKAVISDGKIPNWAALPYHVLLQIFVYASHPLHDENFTPTPAIPWLARVARMCASFTKPALTALYRNPPIFAIRQNRKDLVLHIISPSANAHEDCSVMVKRLEFDATRMSKLTDTTNSVTDLAALVRSVKTLKEIDIFDPFDKPPYRPRARTIRRWYYPEELFEALRQSELRLTSWRWNSAYCARGLLWIKEIHETAAFRNVRELALTKFHSNLPAKSEEGNAPIAEELLGSALATLQNLSSLSFETCGIVNERLLPLLPKSLRCLTIINCRDLFSEPLQAFLTSHGNGLEELILNHNQCLDLSFLVDLKSVCPRLEVLKMDMHYYNSLSTSTDNEPLYDRLLEEGEIPTWPSTLQVLDMEFLRNWSPTAAVAFFTSLIDAAADLPWLREIIITAMVDIDWRQRAKFRKRWTARFQNVFARRTKPPSPHLVSLRAFREWKANGDGKTVVEDDTVVAAGTSKDQLLEDGDSDSDRPLLRARRHDEDEKWDAKRLRDRGKSEDSEEDDGSDELDDDDHVQGLCHTVLFRVDNSRPQEQIYDEADFLDDEVSGDEDWDGNDIVEDTYAW